MYSAEKVKLETSSCSWSLKSDLEIERSKFIQLLLPSFLPSFRPSVLPSIHPSVCPSFLPSFHLSVRPSIRPSFLPSVRPSVRPSILPPFHPSFPPSFLHSFLHLCNIIYCFVEGVFVSSSQGEDVQYSSSSSIRNRQVQLLARKLTHNSAAC